MAHLLQKDDLSLNDCAVIATDNYIPGLDTVSMLGARFHNKLSFHLNNKGRSYTQLDSRKQVIAG